MKYHSRTTSYKVPKYTTSDMYITYGLSTLSNKFYTVEVLEGPQNQSVLWNSEVFAFQEV